MINKQGGMNPANSEEMKRAEEADLITLPTKIPGTNCMNCKFIKPMNAKGGQCNHPKVLQLVTGRNCCSFWDSEGAYRPWKGKA